jgi:glutamate formiminotransferase
MTIKIEASCYNVCFVGAGLVGKSAVTIVILNVLKYNSVSLRNH